MQIPFRTFVIPLCNNGFYGALLENLDQINVTVFPGNFLRGQLISFLEQIETLVLSIRYFEETAPAYDYEKLESLKATVEVLVIKLRNMATVDFFSEKNKSSFRPIKDWLSRLFNALANRLRLIEEVSRLRNSDKMSDDQYLWDFSRLREYTEICLYSLPNFIKATAFVLKTKFQMGWHRTSVDTLQFVFNYIKRQTITRSVPIELEECFFIAFHSLRKTLKFVGCEKDLTAITDHFVQALQWGLFEPSQSFLKAVYAISGMMLALKRGVHCLFFLETTASLFQLKDQRRAHSFSTTDMKFTFALNNRLHTLRVVNQQLTRPLRTFLQIEQLKFVMQSNPALVFPLIQKWLEIQSRAVGKTGFFKNAQALSPKSYHSNPVGSVVPYSP